MGYFDRTTVPSGPNLPAPRGLQLWDDGTGGRLLAWERPLAPCDGFVILAGPTFDALDEVARLSGGRKASLRWHVPDGSGPYLAVACLRGTQIGEASPVVIDDRRQPTSKEGPSHNLETAAVEPVTTSASLQCGCCTPPRPLASGNGALVCPHSGEEYAVLSSGELLRAIELPYGLCRCCEARQPLIRSGALIVCYANPMQEYRFADGRYAPVPTDTTCEALADATAIDAALRANSALLGVNGVFVGSS